MKHPILLLAPISIVFMCCFSNCCKKPDLIVKDLAVTWTDDEQIVSFKVENIGKSSAEDFMVYVTPEEDPISPNHRPQIREHVDLLEAGDVKDFTDLDFAPLAHPDNNLLGNVNRIVVMADPKGQVDECHDDNNEQSEVVSAINIDCYLQSEFEMLTTGTTYNALGTTFSSDNLDIELVQFYWGNGSPSPSGFAEVQNYQRAGGTGKDVWTNNMNLAFQLPSQVHYISFNAGHYGGNMNLGINGTLHNFGDVTSINGITIAGLNITATGSKNTPGIWEFNGPIDSFYVGGQEFVIDNVCVK